MVIAYLRVSTNKQHLNNQKEEIEKFASRKGLVIDRWVKEVVSGKKKEKDRELGKLIKRIKKGDILIVTEISRLSRSLLDIMSILGVLLEEGVLLYSTKDGYEFDDSISSQIMAFAFGLAAQIEHKLISQRTKEALAVRKASGMKLGRAKGDNYKQQRLAHNKEKILEMQAQGYTTKSICRYFNISRDTFYAFKKNGGLK
ncbi:recombinase family protein [Barnesiella propionica]|uniref:recombinase family protein n=1 Tax=Barnesiella propionica TaxID=2981781 RepID=UPI0011C75D7E|nr:recombinase family protein [Barnesiella propionica]MCU6769861.1 recombinase family protein [Barnesiella propionica]